MKFHLSDRSTHPTVGSLAWGSEGIPYRVTRRFKNEGQFFICIATPHGDRTLPLSQVTGWCPVLPIGTAIISDTGWPCTITGFDPADGTYQVEGNCIIGWLYPDQIQEVIADKRGSTIVLGRDLVNYA